ncbi:MAG: tetratricopeptide repeat protein [Pirellulales bacterium]
MLAVLAALAYGNSLDAPFMLDDQYLFSRDPSMRSLAAAWATPPSRRLGFLSFALNYQGHGFWLPGYHLTNIAIHLVAAVALFGLARGTLARLAGRVRLPQSPDLLAAAIAALWLVHPLQTASVTYVIQRFESLMGMLCLFGLYALMKSAARGRRWGWQALSLLAIMAAGHTKEIAVVFPVVAAAYDRIFLADSWRAVLRQRGLLHAGYGLVSGWIVYQSRVLFDPQVAASAGLGVNSLSPWEYLRSQAGVLLHYLKLSLWPDHLCLDYAWPVAREFREIYPAGLVILLLLGATLFALRRQPAWGFLGLSFFAILAPTSSFMPVLDLAFEHRMYLPLAAVVSLWVIGLAVGIGRWCADTRQARRVVGGLLALTLSALSARTVVRNADYTDGIRMWRSVVAANPRNSRAHFMLGVRLSAAGFLEEAEQRYEVALQLRPDLFEARIGIGNLRMREGRWTEAEVFFRQGLAHPRTVPLAHANLGRLREKQERPTQALFHYRQAVMADPRYQQAWEALATVAEQQGRTAEAADALRRVNAMDPLALAPAGRLVILLASTDDPRVRRIDEALTRAEQLVRQTGRGDRFALECLATAQAAAGQYEMAADTVAAALQLPGDSAGRQRLQRAVVAYRRGQPATVAERSTTGLRAAEKPRSTLKH